MLLGQSGEIKSSLLRLDAIHPDGTKHFIGYQYWHRNPVRRFIIGFPLSLVLRWNTARHNARFPITPKE